MKPIKYIFITGIVAFSACTLWRTQSQQEYVVQPNGIISKEPNQTKPPSFYLKTDEGFDNIEPVHFQVPFTLNQAQWESKTPQSELKITFDANPLVEARDAGFCVEVVANNRQLIVWWGHHLRLRKFENVAPDEAIVVRMSDNSVVAHGKAKLKDRILELELPMKEIRVDSVYLYFAPSEQAFRQGGAGIVSALHAHPAPSHGRRVQRIQGGYEWVSQDSR